MKKFINLLEAHLISVDHLLEFYLDVYNQGWEDFGVIIFVLPHKKYYQCYGDVKDAYDELENLQTFLKEKEIIYHMGGDTDYDFEETLSCHKIT